MAMNPFAGSNAGGYGSFAQPQPWYSQFGSALNKNSNMLLGLGSGLLSGNLANIPQGIAAGSQADSAYAASKKADQDRQSQINQTAAWIKQNYPQFANLPPEQGFQLATQMMGKTTQSQQPTTDIQNYEYGLTHPGFGGGGSQDISLMATWGIDNVKGSPTYGQQVVGQIGKDGKFHRTEMNGITPIDPAAMAASKATATTDAKSAATARAMLPGAQQAFDLANKAADTLLTDTAGMQDQFGNTLGFPNQMMPMARPGSDMARFRTELEQGQGNAFLQARQVLKGAGQVTDYEGAKAEAAYSRMALAAKNNNQQEFVTAVTEFKQAVAEGYAKLQAAAQGGYAAGGPGVTGQQGGETVTSTGVSWSVN